MHDVTVMVDDPVTPLALAVIDAVPGATPVTNPEVETVATAVLVDAHAKVVAVLGGEAVAVSWTVCPATTVVVEGETWIDFTFGPPCPPLAKDGDVGPSGACR